MLSIFNILFRSFLILFLLKNFKNFLFNKLFSFCRKLKVLPFTSSLLTFFSLYYLLLFYACKCCLYITIICCFTSNYYWTVLFFSFFIPLVMNNSSSLEILATTLVIWHCFILIFLFQWIYLPSSYYYLFRSLILSCLFSWAKSKRLQLIINIYWTSFLFNRSVTCILNKWRLYCCKCIWSITDFKLNFLRLFFNLLCLILVIFISLSLVWHCFVYNDWGFILIAKRLCIMTIISVLIPYFNVFIVKLNIIWICCLLSLVFLWVWRWLN